MVGTRGCAELIATFGVANGLSKRHCFSAAAIHSLLLGSLHHVRSAWSVMIAICFSSKIRLAYRADCPFVNVWLAWLLDSLQLASCHVAVCFRTLGVACWITADHFAGFCVDDFVSHVENIPAHRHTIQLIVPMGYNQSINRGYIWDSEDHRQLHALAQVHTLAACGFLVQHLR